MYPFYVYIVTNRKYGTLYIGVTNNLPRRLQEHKDKVHKDSFTAKYDLRLLVYCEGANRIDDAIAREKQLKAGSRRKKIALIESVNPDWEDLSESFDGWVMFLPSLRGSVSDRGNRQLQKFGEYKSNKAGYAKLSANPYQL